jgi:hypothetical protein
MKRLAGCFGLALIALASACTTGSVDGDDTGPVGDDEEDEILCQTDLDVAGTFTVSDAQPAEIVGCWPIGTWTWQATVTSNNCAQTPALLPSYSFRGERDLSADDPNYAWDFIITAPNDPLATVGVQSGGGGQCSAGLLYYTADGHGTYSLHPAIQDDGSLIGHGTYQQHTLDQRPQGE